MADSGVEVVPIGALPVEEPKEKETPVEESAAAEDGSTVGGIPQAGGEHKRKLDDLEPQEEDGAPLKKQEVSADADVPASGGVDGDIAAGDGEVELSHPDGENNGSDDLKSRNVETTEAQEDECSKQDPIASTIDSNTDTEQGHFDAETNGSGGLEVKKSEVSTNGNGELLASLSSQDASKILVENGQASRKIEVPNNKVGVLIGKAGDTIKYLQYNSGAKIQITKDGVSDPLSSTRPVELLGTLEQVMMAEKLIKDVMAEADAGGSPSLVARGFGTVQSGGEQIEIKVSNEKVGLIIGKGGETIKNLQTRSGARIQLIPQHLPEGDASKERIVRITGNRKQIESAKDMVNEAMNKMPIKHSSHSGGYSQQAYQPRGPAMLHQWGSRPTGPTQSNISYDYPTRGTYPTPQGPQHPQTYGGYSQQPPPRGSFGHGWDQRQGGPARNPPPGGYDYYGQGGQSTENQASTLMPNPSSAPNNPPVNYNYGNSQAPGYGHHTPYAQTAPMQQNYGQGYNEPKYDTQVPNQQYYGQQQPMGMQPYGQASAPQSQYGQPQPYGKPGYGVPQEVPATYGQPRANQPGDPMYQGSGPTYGSSAPGPQSYPYASNGPLQPAPAYNQTYGTATGGDGYSQPQGAYPHHGGQAAPVYGQGGQPMPAYTQPASQPGSYGQYPTSQQSYGDPATGNTGYQYPVAPADGYGNAVPNTGYGAAQPPSGQPAYAQPATNPSGYYDQSMPQAG